MWIEVEEKEEYGASDNSDGSRTSIGRKLMTEDYSRAQINPEAPGRMNRDEYPVYQNIKMSAYHLHDAWSERAPPRRGPTTLKTEKRREEPKGDPNYETSTLRNPTSRFPSRHICHDF
jgi:hypothetical protein